MTAVLSVALLFATPVAPSHATWMGVEPVGPATVEGTVARLDQHLWKELEIWRSSPPAALTAGEPVPIWLTETATFTDPQPPPVSFVPIEPPALLVEANAEITPPSPPPAPPVTLRERALNRFAELGAAAWQIRVFDCIGYAESGWQSKRSNKQNSNGTYDHGWAQINDIHWPKLNALGLDPYIPEDAATYAWRLSTQGSNFLPWSVHALCGV